MEKSFKLTSEDVNNFKQFLSLQKSGKINMNDIVRASKLAGLSEEKYIDIMSRYEEYKDFFLKNT